MKYKKCLLFFIIIFSMISSSFFISNTVATSDINYTLTKDIFYNENTFNFDNPSNNFNIRNSTSFTGLYNATFSFTNEIVNTTDLDIEWIDAINGDATFFNATIIESNDNHNKVLKFETSGSDVFSQWRNNDIRTEGIIEFWIKYIDNGIGDFNFLGIQQTSQTIVDISFDSTDNKLKVKYGATIDSFNALENQWYHIKMSFNMTSDTQSIWFNGILIVDNENFVSNNVGTEAIVWRFQFDDFGGSNKGLGYVDAIGHNWLNYTIGSNIVPIITIDSSIKEPNRDEFSLTELIPTEQQRPIGSDDFGEWDEIESDGDKVNIVADALENSDRMIRIIHDDGITPREKGIQKEFGISSSILNITYELEFSQFSGGFSEYKMLILSSDSTTVLRVFFEGTFFKHGTGVGTVIETGLTTNEIYIINLYINYNDDIAVIRFFNEGILTSITIIPLLVSGKEGLFSIINTIDGAPANNMALDLDYIGIYSEGVSLSSEFGYMRIPLINTPNRWIFNNHNIFSFDINSTSMSFLVSETAHLFGIDKIRRLNPIDNYIGFSRFSVNDINIGLPKPHFVGFGMIWIQIFSQTQIFEITIEGTKLIHGTNEPFLQFTHGNVADLIDGTNITESFFYTDTNNKLQFTHISNDTETEFIQAKFNINDTTTVGARISFISLINNNAKGFFRINYTTTSDFFPFKTFQSTTSILLTQGKTIRDFLIIITDLDNDNITGLTSGFVSDIKVLYIENISITIITLSLIGMIIPLIIILTPTVALRDLYGKSFVIPMFLLMSLILVIGGIIPIWLFFIIAISSSLFLIKENIVQKDD